LLHVVDIAHAFHDNQIDVVNRTLVDIGAGNIPTILVLNKIDLWREKEKNRELSLEEMKGYYRELGFENIVFISAAAQENITELKKLLFEEVKKVHLKIYPNYMRNGYEFLDNL
jgi:GTP-binding protein HflX